MSYFLHIYAFFDWNFLHTKVCKLRQNRFCDKSTLIATKPNFLQNSTNCTYVETFYTSHTCQMWRSFIFLHICYKEKSEITPHVEKIKISPNLSCGEMWNCCTCEEISEFSTSVMHRNLIFFHMTIFPRICMWDLWQIWGMLHFGCKIKVSQTEPAKFLLYIIETQNDLDLMFYPWNSGKSNMAQSCKL